MSARHMPGLKNCDGLNWCLGFLFRLAIGIRMYQPPKGRRYRAGESEEILEMT